MLPKLFSSTSTFSAAADSLANVLNVSGLSHSIRSGNRLVFDGWLQLWLAYDYHAGRLYVKSRSTGNDLCHQNLPSRRLVEIVDDFLSPRWCDGSVDWFGALATQHARDFPDGVKIE